MKSLSYIIIISCIFIVNGCSVVDYLFYQSAETDQNKLMNLISAYRDSSYTTVNFDELRRLPDSYHNNYYELRGYILDVHPDEFLFYADPYFDQNYGFFYVNIDNPLPKQSGAGQPLRHLTVGDKITLIAQMKGIRSYPVRKPLNVPINNYVISVRGEDFQDIPLFKGIAIFKLEDNYLTVPQWVNAEILEQFGSPR